jgi:LacI family transcriptional regulator
VLGVDNDQLLCDLTDPTLSSIVPDTHKAGYLAAATLAKLMAHQRAPDMRLIPPRGVVTRRSTDGLAIDDVDVSAAMRFIREHACEGINVEDLLDHVPLSRRVLEARFKRAINRTPHEQILRLQLQRAKELLTETRMPLSQIAAACGFRHAEYLSVVFKKHEGVPPSHYRAAHGEK